MGASASLMEIADQPELTKEIHEEYEKLKAEEKTEVEIETILKEKYKSFVNKVYFSHVFVTQFNP